MEQPNIIHEEIKVLRQKLAEKQEELSKSGNESGPESAAKEVIKEYSDHAAPAQNMQTADDQQTQKAIQKLKNEPHAEQVGELLNIAKKNGIIKAVEVAKHLKNPHLLDDFHDSLVLELLKEKENG
ncbi:MAG: hypothetical protein HYW09_01275 [Candidatus Niyogibacteria bacterium]|nr:hypothetical protein [Candidatus Niyogibacteria bacterium]